MVQKDQNFANPAKEPDPSDLKKYEKPLALHLEGIFYRSTRYSLPVTILNIFFVSYMVYGSTQYSIVYWTAVIGSLTFFRLVFAQYIARHALFLNKRINGAYLGLTCLSGILWGLLPLSLVDGPSGEPLVVVAAISVLIGTCAGVSVASATNQRAVILFNLPALSLMAVFFLQDISDLTVLMAVLSGIFFFGTKRISAEVCASIIESKINEEKLRDSQDELQRKNQEIQVIATDARAASAAKTHFLSLMSHELRTPLNSIIGFSQIINKEVKGEIENKQYVEYAGIIGTSAEHLLKLVSDILDVSMIESGKLELNEEPFDLRQSLDRMIAAMQPIVSSKSARLAMDFTLGETVVTGDETKLRQAYMNIIANSAKFVGEQGRIDVIVSDDEAGDLVIEIQDNGPGIAKEDLARIFEPFFQGSSEEDMRKVGVGLGLYITKRITEAHGGTIRLSSIVNEGTTVTITLPKERVE